MKVRILICALLCLSFFVGPIHAQEDTRQDEIEQNFEQIKTERLKRIRKEMLESQDSINLIQKKLRSGANVVSRVKLQRELAALKESYEQKKFLFIETATNINLANQIEPDTDNTLSQDFQQILKPLIEGFKSLSKRPREVQSLKDKVDVLAKRLEQTKLAKAKLQKLAKKKNHKELKPAISKAIETVESEREELEIKLEDSQFRLLKLEQAGGDIVSYLSQTVFGFIKTKGKNLLLSLLAFGFIYWFFKLGRDRVISLVMRRLNRLGDHEGQAHWMKRPLKVFYGLGSFVTALSVAILTLYVLNDWVLITFVVFLLVAIVWSSKEYAPQYFEQFKIVLNFGTIREGERVVYQGLPWKIKSLGYYCRLENPALSGASFRINSKELLSAHSRLIMESEPWFPTQVGDWVELNDDTYGKVLLQSPERVLVKLIGDQTKYVPTAEFLKMNPVNLSRGYGIEIVFRVDYIHQAIVLEEMMTTFKEHIQKRLQEDFPNEVKSFSGLSLEFKEAAENSLDLYFYLKCEGRLASKKLILTRRIKSFFVEACNLHEYVFPFNQVTVHHVNEVGKQSE